MKKSGKIIIATAVCTHFNAGELTVIDQGCVAQDAPPEVFFGAQRNERIRAFLGQIAA